MASTIGVAIFVGFITRADGYIKKGPGITGPEPCTMSMYQPIRKSQKGTGEKTNCEKAIALAKGTPYEFTPDATALALCDTELDIKERSGSEISAVRRKIELDCPECDRVYTGTNNLYVHIRNAHGLKVRVSTIF